MSGNVQMARLDQLVEEARSNGSGSTSLAAAILDSLTANVALLDSTGVVVTANAAWKHFAADRHGDSAGYIGANYLAVCEASVDRRGNAGGTAAAALHGIRAVLRGERESFVLVYDCHSLAEKRWFRLRATRFLQGGHTGCVVAHEDITTEKLAEEQLLLAQQQLRESLRREQLLARTDPLTGLINRRHFVKLAEHECAVAQRYGLSLAVVLFDIDGFKGFNDSLGHLCGDEILKEVAGRATEQLRSADVLGRYGGDEFIILAPGSTAHSAGIAAERIRNAIATKDVQTGTAAAAITLSAGVAELRSNSDTLEDLIRRADRALYEAKSKGRNRTVVS